VRRFHDAANGCVAADAIYNVEDAPPANAGEWTIIDPMDPTRRKQLATADPHEDLLVPIFRDGQLVYDLPSIEAVRERTQSQLARLHAGIKRFTYPHQYPVGLEQSLHELRTRLILAARGLEPKS